MSFDRRVFLARGSSAALAPLTAGAPAWAQGAAWPQRWGEVIKAVGIKGE